VCCRPRSFSTANARDKRKRPGARRARARRHPARGSAPGGNRDQGVYRSRRIVPQYVVRRRPRWHQVHASTMACSALLRIPSATITACATADGRYVRPSAAPGRGRRAPRVGGDGRRRRFFTRHRTGPRLAGALWRCRRGIVVCVFCEGRRRNASGGYAGASEPPVEPAASCMP